MKENSPEKNVSLDRNWVLKRKRRKLQTCSDKSSEGDKIDKSVKLASTARSKHEVKEDDRSSNQFSGKKKGNDGHYYECVVCELGGKLLCCDKCPRTYHLECLDPALKRIPTGKWECPTCCEQHAHTESTSPSNPVTKGARTKIIIRRSKTGAESSTTENAPREFESPHLGKKRQLDKGKVSLSNRHQTADKLDCDRGEDSLNAQGENPIGLAKELLFLAKKKKKSVKIGKGESPDINRESPEKNSPGMEPVLARVAADILAEKKKRKTYPEENEKNRTKQKSQKKQKITGRETWPTKRKIKVDMASILKGETSPEGAFPDSLESEDALRNTVDLSSFEEDATGFQQVDRVVGCRVVGDNTLTPAAGALVADEPNKPKGNPKPLDGCVGENSAAYDQNDDFSDFVQKEGSDSMLVKIKSRNDVSEILKECRNPDTSESGDDESSKEIKNAAKRKLADTGSSVSYEFLVKWVDKSHIHNTWIPESELKALAKRKLENYKAKYGTAPMNLCKEQWKTPQRVIAMRSSANGSTEACVKWVGLQYDECTWEPLDEPVLANSPYLLDSYVRFERKTLENDGDIHAELPKSEVTPLTQQPKELAGGSLFPHQMEALNWLRKSWQKSRNVILADEMGLGKTVSACAFLSSLRFEFNITRPCLVLVPLSTMPNWMSEFSLWAPGLNVVEYHGNTRARAAIRRYEWHSRNNGKTSTFKFDVLLTTYEMVLCDSSHLRGVPWEVLVVDEGHRLKNSESKLFGLLNTFSFQHRVLLTGTPLQNNIGEMYNLLNFLQQASFPSLSSFEEKFNDLTTAEKIDELKKLVAPHMLRRLKKDAMQNIPPKIERVVPVELSSVQAEYYRAMLTKNYQILRNIGKGVPHQSMLNIVMQLRKVCNHPYLIPGTEPESGSVEFLHEMRIKASAKLTLLHSMLKALHNDGHRVLIFSQMTKLLDILEDYLTVEFGPKTYERVDGSVSVSERQAAIARFNHDKSRFVFLLSTRSCGLGINLATADTVVIYDSDFNPHADIQAMNRAHRIGQSNRLLVYRLVVRASVEERILQLAKKKLMLDQLFVNKSGSQKEVEDILKWGTEELFGENRSNEDEDVAEIEPTGRRRTGGLGNVYKDRCADGNNKSGWDKNAILTLLDRSNLQSGSVDNAEPGIENDLLGSVKSLEWHDEATEDQAGNVSAPAEANETVGSACEKVVNVVSATEENEWDRLLRVRWEKHQNEEEASLGRGKRQRKAVSYREAYVLHPNDVHNESGVEEEREREPEPVREYTPAGRALKEKYAKLRARQKERLARKKDAELTAPPPSTNQQAKQVAVESIRPRGENSSCDDSEDQNQCRPAVGPSGVPDPTLSLERMPKQLPVISAGLHLPEGSRDSPNDALLPKIGLCGPDAPNRVEPLPRRIMRPQQRQAHGMEFPFLSPALGDLNARNSGAISAPYRMPDFYPSMSRAVPNVGPNIPDKYLPFTTPHSMNMTKGKGIMAEPLGAAGGVFSDFQDKMLLPRLPFNERLLPRYTLPSPNIGPDSFPSFSLGGFSDLPMLPSFKYPPELPRQQEQAMPPPHQMPPPFPSFPENHRKVLENIMLRTGAGPSGFPSKGSRTGLWSEDELDYLWIGVRRHGTGNWAAMLLDPRLRFSKFKTPDDLAERWRDEQLKITEGSKPPAPPAPASCPYSGMPNEMSPLHGARPDTRTAWGPYGVDTRLGLPGGPPLFEPPKFSGGVFTGKLSPSSARGGDREPRFLLNSVGESFVDPSGPKQRVGLVFPGPNITGGSAPTAAGSNLADTTGRKPRCTLPHWLREVIKGGKPPQPETTPPALLGLARSIIVLFGQGSSLIPPFVVPGPPPSKPNDPRKKRKKKKKIMKAAKKPGDVGSTSASRAQLRTTGSPRSDAPAGVPASEDSSKTDSDHMLPENRDRVSSEGTISDDGTEDDA